VFKMKNYVQDGNVLTEIAPSGGVISGTAYKIGSVVAVSLEIAAEGLPFESVRCGVFSLAVTPADTPAVNSKAYFKSDNTITTTASGNTLVGVFRSAKDAANFADVLFTGQIA
jgi:predicted RecA/RadA family phage recombinase